jgi:hypothetical protein
LISLPSVPVKSSRAISKFPFATSKASAPTLKSDRMTELRGDDFHEICERSAAGPIPVANAIRPVFQHVGDLVLFSADPLRGV